ncbi:hypothetical protein F4W66_24995 (plasmid) [Escherichia coli]|nr:hypothetical protein F4W66_24995 [Escherichia coli]
MIRSQGRCTENWSAIKGKIGKAALADETELSAVLISPERQNRALKVDPLDPAGGRFAFLSETLDVSLSNSTISGIVRLS